MSEEEKNLVNKIEQWINKEEEYLTNEDFKELLNILDKYVELYKAEKEKNKKIEDKIKEATKEMKRRMNLANECIEQEIVIADSDSLNYGRAQAHDVDSVLLKEILE